MNRTVYTVVIVIFFVFLVLFLYDCFIKKMKMKHRIIEGHVQGCYICPGELDDYKTQDWCSKNCH